MGLEGVAGAGNPTLASVREGAEHEGYKVRGLAPTSRAAHKVRDQSPEANEDVVGTTESRTLLESIT